MPGQSRSQQSEQQQGSASEQTTQQAGGAGNAANQAQIEPNQNADGESTVEQLREAAKGIWWQLGNVDEGLCLRLIGQLTPSEKGVVRNDHALMNDLAGALNESEMVLAVNQLGFALVWKAYWIQVSGETADAAWSILLDGTSAQERIDLVNWSSFSMVKEAVGTPLSLFGDFVGTASWDTAMSTSQPLIRWLAETLTAAQVIEEIAATGDYAAVVANVKAAGKWTSTIDALPIGSDLPGTTKIALRDLAGELGLADVKKLFEKRFNAATEGRFEDANGKATTADEEGATEVTWSKDDLLAVWDVLENLPDQDVAENTVIRAYQAISGTGAFYQGPMANQERSGTIKLGQGLNDTGDPHDLSHAVMHEVGHAVHRRINGVVNPWLQKAIGFWYMPSGETGITQLISAMGGFPATYKDFANQDTPFSDDDKQKIKDMLVAHVGDESWDPANPVPDTSIVAPADGQHGPITEEQHLALLWMAMPQKIKTCCELSDDPWYSSYTTLPTGPKGRYFLNHWYNQPFYFSDTAKVAIDATGEDYSAMSHKEFFANCYAEYFKDPAGYADHSKWGGSLNAPVKDFFKNHVLERQPYTPPSPDGSTSTDPGESTQGADGTPA